MIAYAACRATWNTAPYRERQALSRSSSPSLQRPSAIQHHARRAIRPSTCRRAVDGAPTCRPTLPRRPTRRRPTARLTLALARSTARGNVRHDAAGLRDGDAPKQGSGCETVCYANGGLAEDGWAVQYHVQYVQPPGTTDSTRVIDMCLTTCNAVGYPCPNGGR